MRSARRTDRRTANIALGIALGVAIAPAAASALDVEVDSDASVQVYEVRAPGTGTFLARRRFVTNLGLRLVQPLGEPESDGRRIRLSGAVRLRLHHDFGEDCLVGRALCVRASDAGEPAGWQPLASPSIVDLPMAWIAVDGLPLGISARLGRQLEVDPIGFVRFDGISALLAPWSWFSLQLLAGLMVRGTSLLGTPQFELQGTMRVDRGAVDPSVAPWTDPPVDTWVAGARLSAGPARWLRLSAGYREAWEPGGTVLRRLGLSATSQPVDLVRIEAIGAIDLLRLDLVDAMIGLELRQAPWSARVSYERRVPRFDPGTIWAWFRTAPIDQLRVGGSVRVGDDLELGLALRGRRADLGQGRADHDAGLEAYVAARIEGIDAGVSGFLWSGALGPTAGLAIDAQRRFVPELAVAAHVGVWHFDDAWREDLYGTVLSESIDATVFLTEQSTIVVELQHAASRVVGHRVRLVAWLRVEAWR